MIGIVVNSGVAVKIAKLIGTSGEGSLFMHCSSPLWAACCWAWHCLPWPLT